MKSLIALFACMLGLSAAEQGKVLTDINPGQVNVRTTIECPDGKFQAMMTKDGLELRSFTLISATGETSLVRVHGFVLGEDGAKITLDKGVKAGDQVTIQKEAPKKP